MNVRTMRSLLVVGAVALVGTAVSLRISAPQRVTAAARAPGGRGDRSSESEATSHGEGDSGFSTRIGDRPSAAAPFTSLVLPPLPTGDFEITLTDSELRAIVDARYGTFLRSPAVSSNMQNRLRELLLERQHAAIDVANAAMVTGLNPIRDLPLIQRAIVLAEQDVDADLLRELGPSVLNALHEFERDRAAQNTIGDLTRVLAGSSEPLRPAQQQDLLRILQQAPAAGVADINGAIYGRFDRRAEISSRAIAAATEALSPRQLEALRQLARISPPDLATGN